MNSDINLFLTFDIDYMNYEENVQIDEFVIVEELLLPYLEKNDIKVTWFIRLDKKIEFDFGSPDYLFIKYDYIIKKMKSLGHLIGWHPHSYVHDNRWKQNTDEQSVLDELTYLLPYVKKYDLNIVRVGWGYQTNKTMKFFNDNKFLIDSSCMARPKYSWDMTVKDWVTSTNKPYFPSIEDYRTEKYNNYEILEVPITVTDISVKTDTQAVKRYVNLAFYNKVIAEPLRKLLLETNNIVTIMHPYEIHKSIKQHHIISFDIEEFIRNINFIEMLASEQKNNLQYLTLDWSSIQLSILDNDVQ